MENLLSPYPGLFLVFLLLLHYLLIYQELCILHRILLRVFYLVFNNFLCYHNLLLNHIIYVSLLSYVFIQWRFRHSVVFLNLILLIILFILRRFILTRLQIKSSMTRFINLVSNLGMKSY